VSASVALAACSSVTCAWPWHHAKLMLLRAPAALHLPLSWKKATTYDAARPIPPAPHLPSLMRFI
jgi:hypothetical protein